MMCLYCCSHFTAIINDSHVFSYRDVSACAEGVCQHQGCGFMYSNFHTDQDMTYKFCLFRQIIDPGRYNP